jgi:FKBP-type peptidyl-prolyl cis-trans isomerase
MDVRRQSSDNLNRYARLAVAAALGAGLLFGLAACKEDKKDSGGGKTPTTAASSTAVNTTPRSTEQASGGPESPPAVSGLPTVTASGLQIIEVQEGTGAVAEVGKTITVHTTGWLEDGTKFYSTLDGTAPLTRPLATGSLIEGWVEGIPGMKAGGKRRLIIPPDLAYGAAGQPPTIPADATLTFDIELLDVQ